MIGVEAIRYEPAGLDNALFRNADGVTQRGRRALRNAVSRATAPIPSPRGRTPRCCRWCSTRCSGELGDYTVGAIRRSAVTTPERTASATGCASSCRPIAIRPPEEACMENHYLPTTLPFLIQINDRALMLMQQVREHTVRTVVPVRSFRAEAARDPQADSRALRSSWSRAASSRPVRRQFQTGTRCTISHWPSAAASC